MLFIQIETGTKALPSQTMWIVVQLELKVEKSWLAAHNHRINIIFRRSMYLFMPFFICFLDIDRFGLSLLSDWCYDTMCVCVWNEVMGFLSVIAERAFQTRLHIFVNLLFSYIFFFSIFDWTTSKGSDFWCRKNNITYTHILCSKMEWE